MLDTQKKSLHETLCEKYISSEKEDVVVECINFFSGLANHLQNFPQNMLVMNKISLPIIFRDC